VWDNTDIASNWLNLMRNALNGKRDGGDALRRDLTL
jgi:hypothetical protein